MGEREHLRSVTPDHTDGKFIDEPSGRIRAQFCGPRSHGVQHDRNVQCVCPFPCFEHRIDPIGGKSTDVEDKSACKGYHLFHFLLCVCHNRGGATGEESVGCGVHDNKICNVMDQRFFLPQEFQVFCGFLGEVSVWHLFLLFFKVIPSRRLNGLFAPIRAYDLNLLFSLCYPADLANGDITDRCNDRT